jgi:ribonuclease HI
MLQGGIARTTNNRMEVTAANRRLRAPTRLCEVVVVTDSDYLRCGMTEFLQRWRSNWWKASSGNPVLNQDRWAGTRRTSRLPSRDVDSRGRSLRAC